MELPTVRTNFTPETTFSLRKLYESLKNGRGSVEGTNSVTAKLHEAPAQNERFLFETKMINDAVAPVVKGLTDLIQKAVELKLPVNVKAPQTTPDAPINTLPNAIGTLEIPWVTEEGKAETTVELIKYSADLSETQLTILDQMHTEKKMKSNFNDATDWSQLNDILSQPGSIFTFKLSNGTQSMNVSIEQPLGKQPIYRISSDNISQERKMPRRTDFSPGSTAPKKVDQISLS